MTESGSVSILFRAIESGDAVAAEQLWNRYFEELETVAEQKIRRAALLGKVESEDVTASVFESLWKGAQLGRFKSVEGRDQLWWLLLSMLHRKFVSHARRELAEQRGAGAVVSFSTETGGNAEKAATCPWPGPESQAMLNDQRQQVMAALNDPVLQRIAEMKIEGHLNDEIGKALGMSSASVTRKLRLIRDTWVDSMAD